MVGPGNHEANCAFVLFLSKFYFSSSINGTILGDNGGTTDKAHNITYTYSICMAGQTNFTGFRNHFRMPSAESGGLENFWYSFDHGMVHYVQLDSETDLGHGLIAPDEIGGSEGEHSGPFSQIRNAQLNWLDKNLASVDRKKTPWIVVCNAPLPFLLWRLPFFCAPMTHVGIMLMCKNSRPSPLVCKRRQ